ncbi:MAG: MFS transporter [Chloroflexota bacterium]|nr:MAG: MFS transporter [Chloroflexota bacterium]
MHDKTSSTAAVLKNRHFLALWMAQVLSQTAQNAILYVLMILVEERTSSTTHMSFLVLSTILPSVVFGMAAGVFVDRVKKKMVLTSTNFLRALLVLLYIVVEPAFALIYLLNLIFSTVGQFFSPAEAATIPLVVKKKQLVTANGLFNITFTVSQLAGFVLVAPPLVKWLGIDTTFIVIAIAYVVAGILVGFLPDHEESTRPLLGFGDLRDFVLRRQPRSGADAVAVEAVGAMEKTIVRNFFEELRQGWDLVRGDRFIALSMLYLTLMNTLMLVMATLAPGFAGRVLGIAPDDVIYIFSPIGVGILLGTVILPSLAARMGKPRLATAGLVLIAAVCLIFGLLGRGGSVLSDIVSLLGLPTSLLDAVSLVSIVIVFAFLSGIAYAFVIVSSQTILQERAPASMRGKVFAIQQTFGNLVSVLPLISLGALADIIGITRVFSVMAGILFLAALIGLRETRKTAPSIQPTEE